MATDEGSSWQTTVQRSDVRVQLDAERSYGLQMRHRSCTVEPATSPLFRVMGAGLWPSSTSFIDFLKDDELLAGHAKRGGSLLELGSGHGLCGLACCFLPTWQRVVLTDKDTRLVDLISWNCKTNEPALSSAATLPRDLCARQLVWGHEDGVRNITEENNGGFDVVLAVGCTYSHPQLDPLVRTIASTLRTESSVAVILHECREDRPSIKGVNKLKRANRGIPGYWRGSKRSDHLTVDQIVEAAGQVHLEVVSMRRGGGGAREMQTEAETEAPSPSCAHTADTHDAAATEPDARATTTTTARAEFSGGEQMRAEEEEEERQGERGGIREVKLPAAVDTRPGSGEEEEAIEEGLWGLGSAVLITLQHTRSQS